mmetsp:Transcript_4714/g.7050  ORF Transcript_4714/g.7050 Transcript_4714/m.7050 type:complete len:126 (-) Transcript_4714:236-613(-)
MTKVSSPFLFLLVALFVVIIQGADQECRQRGECVACLEIEEEEEYCTMTGFKQECFETLSQKKSVPTVHFVGCYPPALGRNDNLSVGLFELASLIVFMLAFSAVIERKRVLTEMQQRKIQSMIAV